MPPTSPLHRRSRRERRHGGEPHRLGQRRRRQDGREFLCQTIGGKGNVVELQGIAGTSAARDRGQGFNDFMKASCPDAKIVAAQTADFNRAKGLSVFENILQAQPESRACSPTTTR